MIMVWMERLAAQLAADRAMLQQVYAGEWPETPFVPFVAHQQSHFGLSQAQARLPEHFRGPWDQAKVCFLGPHVMLVQSEPAPGLEAAVDVYTEHYRSTVPKRDPYGHYNAIADGAPWVATELVHWPCEKDLALQVLKTPQGAEVVDAALELTWAMLRESPVETLVLTGNDALKWVMPRLGGPAKLPGVTQIHGQRWRLPLPGAPGRELKVVASFHWSAEMPMFVRKVKGLEGRTVGEAISGARRMINNII